MRVSLRAIDIKPTIGSRDLLDNTMYSFENHSFFLSVTECVIRIPF